MTSPYDDELRARLARIDPVHPAVSSEPMSSLRAQNLLERAMSTTTESPTPSAPAAPARRRGILAVAAVLAIGAATGGVLLSQGDDDKGTDTIAAKTSVTFALPGGDPMMQMCMPFSADVLKDMTPAFAATATAVEPTRITLDVDRWYTGGDADQVVLTTADNATSAALDGVSFEKGKRYLVTAAQGVVNGCGYSGLATPDLEKSFDEAFPK